MFPTSCLPLHVIPNTPRSPHLPRNWKVLQNNLDNDRDICPVEMLRFDFLNTFLKQALKAPVKSNSQLLLTQSPHIYRIASFDMTN